MEFTCMPQSNYSSWLLDLIFIKKKKINTLNTNNLMKKQYLEIWVSFWCSNTACLPILKQFQYFKFDLIINIFITSNKYITISIE